MSNLNLYIKEIISGLITLVLWLIGGFDIAIKVLFVLMVLDIITGVMRGYENKTLSSRSFRQGLNGKAMIFVIIIVANMVDILIGQPVFRTFVCVFYAGGEGISILENASALGLQIPQKLEDALIQLKEGGRKETKHTKK